MKSTFVVLLLLSPFAAGASEFLQLSLEDAAGDVIDARRRAIDRPSADIREFNSYVENGTLWLLIRMAAAPIAPNDTIELRVWFKDSVNGSFDLVDLTVNGAAPDPNERLEATLRRARYENATRPDVRYFVEDTTWTFAMNVSYLDGADCFDVNVQATHTPKRQAQGFDALRRSEGGCVQSPEPEWSIPDIIVPQVGIPPPPPSIEPPGSRAPTPGSGVGLALLAALASTSLLSRR